MSAKSHAKKTTKFLVFGLRLTDHNLGAVIDWDRCARSSREGKMNARSIRLVLAEK